MRLASIDVGLYVMLMQFLLGLLIGGIVMSCMAIARKSDDESTLLLLKRVILQQCGDCPDKKCCGSYCPIRKLVEIIKDQEG